MARLLEPRRPGEILTVRREEVMADGDWYQSPHVGDLRRALDCDSCLFANMKLDTEGQVAILAFHRPWSDRPFGERERAITETFWEEAAHLVPRAQTALGGLRAGANGKIVLTRPLSPRRRQILGCLLRGQSASEIAHALGLSKYTVRDPIRELHQTPNVRV